MPTPSPRPPGPIVLYKVRDDGGAERFYEFEADAIKARNDTRKSGVGAEAYEVRIPPSPTGFVRFLNEMRTTYPEKLLR